MLDVGLQPLRMLRQLMIAAFAVLALLLRIDSHIDPFLITEETKTREKRKRKRKRKRKEEKKGNEKKKDIFFVP